MEGTDNIIEEDTTKSKYNPSFIHSHIQTLHKWKADPRILEQIKGTGFEVLLSLDKGVRNDKNLIAAVMNFYDKDRFFRINGHRLGMTLEDVSYITGLPIDGEPVVCNEEPARALCIRCLGTSDFLEKNSSHISLRKLRKAFDPKNNVINDETIMFHVRAYLLYILGSVLLPDNSACKVNCQYLPLLEDIGRVKSYAWGAAALAAIHASLQHFMNKSSKETGKRNTSPRRLKGPTYMLMFFFLERIPKLARIACFPHDYRQRNKNFPLMEGWSKALLDKSRSSYDKTKEEDYMRILNSLDESSIIWQPYNNLRKFLPRWLSDQRIVASSVTMLICCEFSVHHRPDLVAKQFGIEGEIPEYVKKGLVKEVVACRRKITNFLKKQEKAIEKWNQRKDFVIQVPEPEEAEEESQIPGGGGSVADGDENDSAVGVEEANAHAVEDEQYVQDVRDVQDIGVQASKSFVVYTRKRRGGQKNIEQDQEVCNESKWPDERSSRSAKRGH